MSLGLRLRIGALLFRGAEFAFVCQRVGGFIGKTDRGAFVHCYRNGVLLPSRHTADRRREKNVRVDVSAPYERDGEGLAGERQAELSHVPNESRHQIEEAGDPHGEAAIIENSIIAIIGIANDDGARKCGQVGQRNPRQVAFRQAVADFRGDCIARDDKSFVVLELADERNEVLHQVGAVVEPPFLGHRTQLIKLWRVRLNALDGVALTVPGNFALLEEQVVIGEQRQHQNRQVLHDGSPFLLSS